jgi:membrane protease YdiL (CAAX protease family)
MKSRCKLMAAATADHRLTDHTPMLKQSLYSFALAFGWLMAVYAPTFVLVSLLLKSGALVNLDQSQMPLASVPFIILISAGIAFSVIAFLARRKRQSLAAYGFKTASLRHLALALVLGTIFAFGLKLLSHILPLGAGPDMGELKQWQLILFFWIGAPIQEEIIFRGLLQSVVELRQPLLLRLGNITLPYPVLVSALLFAVVHIATVRLGASLSEALFVVGGAFVLGLLAGALRWVSGSLLPAIVVHALFNMLAG